MIINESNNKLLLSLTENDLWRLSQGKKEILVTAKKVTFLVNKPTNFPVVGKA